MKGRRPFNDEEVKTILAAFKSSTHKYAPRDLALFVYGISTGFRISELLSMRIKDVSHNWKVHTYVTVRRNYTKGKAESSHKQVEEWVLKYMQEWIDILKEKNHSKNDFIFQSQWKGNRHITREYYNNLLVELCTSNGIYGNIGTHSMRKTFANKLRNFFERMQKETDIPFNVEEELQKEGRWKSREAMEKYLSFRSVTFKESPFNYED